MMPQHRLSLTHVSIRITQIIVKSLKQLRTDDETRDTPLAGRRKNWARLNKNRSLRSTFSNGRFHSTSSNMKSPDSQVKVASLILDRSAQEWDSDTT